VERMTMKMRMAGAVAEEVVAVVVVVVGVASEVEAVETQEDVETREAVETLEAVETQEEGKVLCELCNSNTNNSCFYCLPFTLTKSASHSS